MPPKLVSDDGHVVIRPGLCGREGHTRWAKVRQFPIIPATCAAARKTCSASRRRNAARVAEKIPRPRGKHGNALQNVVPSHLLDGALYDL
jgi:tRNA 2-thiocytidine biosynthesis protein TtcA